MNQDVLDEVLSCSSLPSLPAVAVRVLELTQNPDVSLAELAATIQNDQGLAAKILRTVNSSFYGLRRKCSTIQQSMAMLGLNTVKSLALGFSLVSCLQGKEGDGFDYPSYWRRAIFSAVGAKLAARKVGAAYDDEVFLGALLQDIGMMALHRALGKRYVDVLVSAGSDHRSLVKAELSVLEVQHPDIGAMLATRWKLPNELVMPVKYHERPSAAPVEWLPRVQAVAFGDLVHDVLNAPGPSNAMKIYFNRAKEWFKLDSTAATELLRAAAEATREMANLFKLDCGPFPDAQQVIDSANERLVQIAHTTPPPPVASTDEGLSTLLRDDGLDPLTGVAGRRIFDDMLKVRFAEAKAGSSPLSVMIIAIDKLADIRRTLGMGVTDEIVLSTATLLKKHFEPIGALVARWDADAFAILLPNVGHLEGVKSAAVFRQELERYSKRTVLKDCGNAVPVTASVGTAAVESWASAPYTVPEQLSHAASKAAQACRAAGGNGVRAFVPKAAA